jgi:soluble lytic murein transglycosylase-like protein
MRFGPQTRRCGSERVKVMTMCAPGGRDLTIVLPVLLLAVLAAVPGVRADVFKYVDAKGNTYFTDAPLKGTKYRLEWKRESRRLIEQNRQVLAALSPRRFGPPSAAAAAALPPVAATPSPAAAPVAIAPEGGTLATRRVRYERLISAYARIYGLSPRLLHAVIRTESAYDSDAVSRAGAQGLMQLMPGTAARYGVKDSFNPVENVRGGAAYLRDLLDLFDQDLRLALAGYNAGENAVIRNGYQIPPYSETQNYVRQVLQHLSAEAGPGG